MGTRALVNLKDSDNKIIITLYKHWDGYPKEGFGEELAEYLSKVKITKGIGMPTPPDSPDGTVLANGVEELAALLVHHFKGIYTSGDVYLYAPGTNDIGEEYTYNIGVNSFDEIVVSVSDEKLLFLGKPAEVLEKIRKYLC